MGRLQLHFLIWVLLVFSTKVYPHNITQDSLVTYSFKRLEESYQNSTEKSNSLLYAQTYLSKAKQVNDFEAISKGYYMIIKASSRENMLIYSDSLLNHNTDRGNFYYVGLAYYLKGTEDYKKGNFSEALEKFIKADEILQNEEDLEERLWAKQGIAVIKKKTGDLEGALNAFLYCLNYYEQKQDWENYAYSAFSTYVLYVDNNKIDSASYFIDKALLNVNYQSKIYPRLIYSKGVILFNSQKYNDALNLFIKSSKGLDSVQDIANLAFSESYLGESYLRINDTTKGIFHLEKAGSFFKSNGVSNSGVRSAIYTLGEIYKTQNNIRKELEYVKILISIDSINSLDNLKLKDSLFLNYEIPEIVKRKNRLITQINKHRNRIALFTIFTIVLLALLFILYIKNKKRNKEKIIAYEKIIAEYKTNFPDKPNGKQISQIPEKDVRILDSAFKTFEDEKHYIKQSFNKEYIKKKTGVNSHYISDYLRDYIGKSLIQYTNDKRIEFSIKKIMEDTNYSKYTMSAMAEEVGFSSPSTFKRVFQIRTGLTPLEFIEKHNNS